MLFRRVFFFLVNRCFSCSPNFQAEVVASYHHGNLICFCFVSVGIKASRVFRRFKKRRREASAQHPCLGIVFLHSCAQCESTCLRKVCKCLNFESLDSTRTPPSRMFTVDAVLSFLPSLEVEWILRALGVLRQRWSPGVPIAVCSVVVLGLTWSASPARGVTGMEASGLRPEVELMHPPSMYVIPSQPFSTKRTSPGART